MGIASEDDPKKIELVKNISEDSKNEELLQIEDVSETIANRIKYIITQSSSYPYKDDFSEIFELLQTVVSDHKSIALKLIQSGNEYFVLENFEKFKGLDKEIILKLIAAGLTKFVALYVFNVMIQYQSEEEFDKRLIEWGIYRLNPTHGFITGRTYLRKEETPLIDGLDIEVAEKLIEAGQGIAVTSNLDKFVDLDHRYIAEKLIKAGQGFAVAEHLEKFDGLDHEHIASGLIVSSQGIDLGSNIEKFNGANHIKIAYELIITHQGYSVARNIEKFDGLDHKEIAILLIENEQGECIAHNIEKFDGLDHKEIAILLIKTGNYLSIIDNLDKFNNLDKEVLSLLIEAFKNNQQKIDLATYNRFKNKLGEHIYRFEGLDKEAATMLFSIGEGSAIADYLHIFNDLNSEEIAFLLIGVGQGGSVLCNWSQFKDLDPSKVANKMIETGQVKVIKEAIDEVEDEIAEKEIVIKLIEAGYCELALKCLFPFSQEQRDELKNLIREKKSNKDQTLTPKKNKYK